MRQISTFALAAILLPLLMILAVPPAQAQVTNTIESEILHPFTVVNTTLPPGKYFFRMVHGTALGAMTVANADDTVEVDFLVRSSVDDHTPRHSELVFNRYGKKEFLQDIYQAGDKDGEAVIEPSREERSLMKQGQKPFRHTEEQEH